MTPDPIIVQTSDDPRAVLEIFLTKKITALPVSDQNGHIKGILSEMNLVKIMVQYSAAGKGKKIGNYPTLLEPAVFVKESDTIGNIVKAMVGSKTHRVLVRGQLEKIVGILSPKDLLKVLAGGEPAGDSAHQSEGA